MSIVQRPLTELKKMQDFINQHGGLLHSEDRQELEAFINTQVRQCELFQQLEQLARQKTAAAKTSEETKNEKTVKRESSRKKTKEKEPPAEEAMELFDDLDDLLG